MDGLNEDLVYNNTVSVKEDKQRWTASVYLHTKQGAICWPSSTWAKSPDGLVVTEHLRCPSSSHSFSPHCRMAQRNVQHCNCMVHSRSHWPAATYWVHTDHSSDLSRWEDTSTDQWLCHSGSQSHYSAPSRCPGNCRHTLK